jgi:hypothetical protein
MPSNTFAYRAAIGLIWALALWHSWICRGLFVDGFAFLVQIATYEWFFDFYPPRLYAMIAGQIPVMTAVILGVTDLHWLARLLSFGFFGLPTIFYTGALWRARHDPVMLASVIAIIAIVFLPVSFFIVGEYNTLYAFATFVGVTLLTADRLRLGEGLMLAVLGAFSIRIYEAMVYVGPLLVALTLWRVWKNLRATADGRQLAAAPFYLLAAALFAWGTWVARDSIVHPFSELSALHLEDTLQQARNFWHNMQFDFVFGPALLIVVWALIWPADLATAKPYRWAALGLGLLVLSPLLAVGDTLIRPLAKAQYVSRVMGGLVACAILMFVWFYRSSLHVRLKATVVLREPPPARRFLAFACLMPLAILPSDIFLSLSWVDFVNDTRAAVESRHGIIPFEETKLSHWPDILLVEDWVLSTQCLAVRSSDADGIILPPKGYSEWVPFHPEEPPNLGRFYWRR